MRRGCAFRRSRVRSYGVVRGAAKPKRRKSKGKDRTPELKPDTCERKRQGTVIYILCVHFAAIYLQPRRVYAYRFRSSRRPRYPPKPSHIRHSSVTALRGHAGRASTSLPCRVRPHPRPRADSCPQYGNGTGGVHRGQLGLVDSELGGHMGTRQLWRSTSILA